MSTSEFRVNEGIRVAEVRLIGPDGGNVGVVPIRQALQIARDAELDLVEVSPNANPPVCRVIDYGKFIYERAKKDREARKSQTKIEVKEIRLRPKTNEAHRGFKVDDARRFDLGEQLSFSVLADGYISDKDSIRSDKKVRVTLSRDREAIRKKYPWPDAIRQFS